MTDAGKQKREFRPHLSALYGYPEDCVSSIAAHLCREHKILVAEGFEVLPFFFLTQKLMFEEKKEVVC